MRRNIWLLEIHEVALCSLFTLPITLLYFQDELNAGFKDYTIGHMAFACVLLMMEVPSGWLADRWKRKHVMLLGSVIWAFSDVVLILSNSAIGGIIFLMLAGIGAALFSGANSATLYDTLLQLGEEKDFTRLEGRRKGYGFYATGISGLAGGYMYEIDHNLPVIATLIAGIIASVTCLFLTEPARHKTEAKNGFFGDIITTMGHLMKTKPSLCMFMIFVAMLFAGTRCIQVIQQQYYVEIAIPEYAFGILYSIGILLGGLASHVNHLLTPRMRNIAMITLAFIATIALNLIAASFVSLWGAVLLMFTGTLIFGLTLPRVMDAINKRIGSDRRATIISAFNLIRALFYVPLIGVIGIASDANGASAGLFVLTLWLTIAALGFGYWIYRRKKARRYKYQNG